MRRTAFMTRALIALTAHAALSVPPASGADGVATARHAPPPFVFPTGAFAFVTLRPTTTVDGFDPADLAIGAVGNHSGHLTMIFSTIARNSSPNIAVGSLSSLGSIVADYIPPAPHSGAGAFGPAPGAPPGPPAGAGGPPMGGFPPPGNCSIEQPVQALGGNVATDSSCGFETVIRSVPLSPTRSRAPVVLAPTVGGTPQPRLSAAACEAYRAATDQLGQARWSESGCTIGAVSAAPPHPLAVGGAAIIGCKAAHEVVAPPAPMFRTCSSTPGATTPPDVVRGRMTRSTRLEARLWRMVHLRALHMIC